MNKSNNDVLNNYPAHSSAGQDVRLQLLGVLKARLATLQEAENRKTSEATTAAPNEKALHPDPTTEHHPLNAETPSELCRNDAETAPEYSASSAETERTVPASQPSHPRGRRSSNESVLDSLPAEIQAQMLHLLDTLTLDAATLEITSKPPYGLGIQTSRSSLDRFHKRQTNARNTGRRQEEAAATIKLIADAKSPGDISLAATHLIALRLIETAVQENSDPAHLLALSKAIDRLHAIQHSERRLRLAEQKSAAG